MGQQGKFLLNKVPENMVWKYNIVNKFNKNNIYFNSKLISQILTFLIKKDVYLLYFRKKKKIFFKKKKINDFLNVEIYFRKKVRNLKRKILYSQLRITRLSDWFIINLVTFTTFKSKNRLLLKNEETYFRLRHYYHYLTPKINNFKCFYLGYKFILKILKCLLLVFFVTLY